MYRLKKKILTPSIFKCLYFDLPLKKHEKQSEIVLCCLYNLSIILIFLIGFIFVFYRLAENSTLIASLNAEIHMYETNHKRLQDQYQLLQDEHQALQLTTSKLEEKLRKTQVSFHSFFDNICFWVTFYFLNSVFKHAFYSFNSHLIGKLSSY